jgi:hypothetical protein
VFAELGTQAFALRFANAASLTRPNDELQPALVGRLPVSDIRAALTIPRAYCAEVTPTSGIDEKTCQLYLSDLLL